MAKCEICKDKIEETFLNKMLGTVVKDENGKKHFVCRHCQSKINDKAEMLAKLK